MERADADRSRDGAVAFSWTETVGRDNRKAFDFEMDIRSVSDILTPPKVLIRDIYFDGLDVLWCCAGRFRFSFREKESVVLEPGEVLVTYPDLHVTIEATASENRLVYGIFTGKGVVDFFNALGFFDGMHARVSSPADNFMELRKRMEVGYGAPSKAWLNL